MATPARRPFSLTGADGGPLRGDFRSAGGSRPAVVICHGFNGFKDWGGHTFGIEHPWSGSTPQFDQVLDATLDWFRRFLAP